MTNEKNSAGEKFFAINSDNWGHKWGYRDSEFVLNKDLSVSMTGDRYARFYSLCGRDVGNEN